MDSIFYPTSDVATSYVLHVGASPAWETVNPPNSDSTYTYSDYTKAGSFEVAFTDPAYIPAISCVFNARYLKRPFDSAGSPVSTEGVQRTVQFDIKQNGTVVWSSPTLDASIVAQDYQASIPVGVFSSWGGLSVAVVLGGVTRDERTSAVAYMDIVFTAEDAAALAVLPANKGAEAPVAVWLDSANLWGYNHTVFIPPIPGSIVDCFSRMGYKNAGIMAEHPVYVNVGGVWIQATNDLVMQIQLDSSFFAIDKTFYMVAFGDTYKFKIVAGDSMADVITYFRDIIRYLGFNCDMDTSIDTLYVQGHIGITLSIPPTQLLTRFRNPKMTIYRSLVGASEWSDIWDFTAV